MKARKEEATDLSLRYDTDNGKIFKQEVRVAPFAMIGSGYSSEFIIIPDPIDPVFVSYMYRNAANVSAEIGLKIKIAKHFSSDFALSNLRTLNVSSQYNGVLDGDYYNQLSLSINWHFNFKKRAAVLID